MIEICGVNPDSSVSGNNKVYLTCDEKAKILSKVIMSQTNRLLSSGGFVTEREQLNIASNRYQIFKAKIKKNGEGIQYRPQKLKEIDAELASNEMKF